MRKWFKTAAVIVGAVVLSTLGISASDTLEGVSGTLVGMVAGTERVAGCGEDAVLLTVDGRRLCVDRFESSPASLCPNKAPRNVQDTEQNLGNSSCKPVSVKDVDPWRFVNLSQAQRACALAGKRLLGNGEWYRAALGTPGGNECNVNDSGAQGPQKTKESSCVSGAGAYDMVGNVWEWTDESVLSGMYRDRDLPQTGYVASVDADGVAVSVGEREDLLYGEDYHWTNKEGVRGMLRGGFYGSGKDGGIYSINASVEPSFASAGVGFRCVRDYPI